MFCRKCGNQINPGSTFCNNCGAPIENISQPQANNYQPNQQPNYQPNMQQNTYQNTQPYQQPNMYQNQQQNAFNNGYNPTYNQNVNSSGISEEEFQRKVNGTKSFCIIVSILEGFDIIRQLISFNIFGVFFSGAVIALLICFYIFCRDKKPAGPILGYVVSGLYFGNAVLSFLVMILSFLVKEPGYMYILSIGFDIAIGIAVLKDCLVMHKYIKANRGN